MPQLENTVPGMSQPESVKPLRTLGIWERFVAYANARPRLILAFVIGLSMLLSILEILTKRPWCDEAWFASAAYNLAQRGFLGITVLDPHGFPFAHLVAGIDRYTFWVMPGYLLVQAALCKLFGMHLFVFRALSTLCSVVALSAWYYILLSLTHRKRVALLAVYLLGVEQYFLRAAASGRMDMMCLTLSLVSVALYLRFRANFQQALLIAACGLAAALFTHPNACFGILLLTIIVLSYDRHKLTVRSLLLASLPFVVLGAAWVSYVLRAPQFFASQLAAQTAIPHRFALSLNLIAVVYEELVLRYKPAYKLGSGSFPIGLEQLPFFIYIAAVALAASIPAVRRQPGVRPILIGAVSSFALLCFLQKNTYYIAYTLPLFTALVAIVALWLWNQSRAGRWSVSLLIPALVGINVGLVAMHAIHNDYQNRYMNAVNFLSKNASPGSLTMGSGELAFKLGFDGQIVDDARLGYISGKRPDLIVLEGQYCGYWFPWFAYGEQDSFLYIRSLLKNDYRIIYDQTRDGYVALSILDSPYQVYQRIPAATKPASLH